MFTRIRSSMVPRVLAGVPVPWSPHLAASAGVLFFVIACRGPDPPPTADSGLQGCYALETNLPGSISDSLGYEIPGVIRLAERRATGEGVVLPTDPEFRPHWEMEGGRVWETGGSSGARGDSVDIVFPGPSGRLVLRVGVGGGILRGRAGWIAHSSNSALGVGATVVARPGSCEELENALRRTPYRSAPDERPGRKTNRKTRQYASALGSTG
ncbi:hypothetical protein ACFL3S_02860 [Gemmatimonadota bacterium]